MKNFIKKHLYVIRITLLLSILIAIKIFTLLSYYLFSFKVLFTWGILVVFLCNSYLVVRLMDDDNISAMLLVWVLSLCALVGIIVWVVFYQNF